MAKHAIEGSKLHRNIYTNSKLNHPCTLVMETLKGTSVFSRLTTVVLVLRSDNVNENKIYKSNSEATAVSHWVSCIAAH